MKTLTREMQEAISPSHALDLLKKGNERFVNNLKVNRNLLQQANETSDGQHPFAVILSCIDSRTSAELIFDQGLGDIFSIRIAGNIVNDDILGSMEFGCKLAGSKIIVVLGHSSCGAVKGACDGAELGHLTGLVKKIEPAVQKENSIKENRTAANSSFVESVAHINVKNSVEEILKRSEIIKTLVDEGKIGLVGGFHDIKTGEVTFFEDCCYINE